MIKVLVVTSDVVLERMLTVTLTINGLTVVPVNMMSEISASLSRDNFQIVLIDEPYADLCSSIKKKGFDVPILILGEARSQFPEINNLAKPFNFPELKAAMNSIFHHQRTPVEKELVFGDIRIDVTKSIVTIKNKMVKLGRMELAIFVSLIKKTGKIVTREKMIKDLEAQGHLFNTAIFHHVKELKSKIKDISSETFVIKGITGEGYQLLLK